MSNANKKPQDINSQAAQVAQEGDNSQTKNTISPVTPINEALSRAQNTVTDAINASDTASVQAGEAVGNVEARIEDKINILEDFNVELADCIKEFLAALSCPILQSFKLLFQSQLHLLTLRSQTAVLQIAALKAVIEGYRAQLALLRAAIQDPQEVVWKLVAQKAPDAYGILYSCVDLATLLDEINKVDFIARARKFIDTLASTIGRLSYQLDRLNFANQIIETIKNKLNKVISYIDFLCIGYTPTANNNSQTTQEAAVVKQKFSEFEKEIGKQLDNSTVTLSDVLALTERENESGESPNTPVNQVIDRVTLAVERILSGGVTSTQSTPQQQQAPLDPSLPAVVQSFTSPDGKTVTQVLADGTVVTRTTTTSGTVIFEKFPDNKTVTIESGKTTTVFPDGCVEVRYDTHSYGIISEYSCPTSGVTTTYADGRVVYSLNGMTRTTDFRGNVKIIDPNVDMTVDVTLPYGSDIIKDKAHRRFLQERTLPYHWSFKIITVESMTANSAFTWLDETDQTQLQVLDGVAKIVLTNGYTEDLPVKIYELLFSSTVAYEEIENVSCDVSRNVSLNDFPILGFFSVDLATTPPALTTLPAVGALLGPSTLADACIQSSWKYTNNDHTGSYTRRRILAEGELITENQINDMQNQVNDVQTFRLDTSSEEFVEDPEAAGYYELQYKSGLLTEIAKIDETVTITEMLDSTNVVQTIIRSTGLTTSTSGMLVSGAVSGFSVTGYTHGLSVLARYDEASTLARSEFADDAFLVSAYTDVSLRKNGLFNEIYFEFYSKSVTQAILVYANANSVTTDFVPIEETSTNEIFDINFDSFRFMRVADDNGARDFRISYQNYSVQFRFETYNSHSVATIVYTDNSNSVNTLVVHIDVTTGQVIT
jgi:hypothetical protein